MINCFDTYEKLFEITLWFESGVHSKQNKLENVLTKWKANYILTNFEANVM